MGMEPSWGMCHCRTFQNHLGTRLSEGSESGLQTIRCNIAEEEGMDSLKRVWPSSSDVCIVSAEHFLLF